MFELLRGGFSSHTAQKYRVAFYHNLSPDTLNQTISTEILKHRDKHSADNYGVQLSEVYVDHAYHMQTERKIQEDPPELPAEPEYMDNEIIEASVTDAGEEGE